MKKPSKEIIGINKQFFENPCGEIFLPNTTNNKKLEAAIKITKNIKESFQELHGLIILGEDWFKVDSVKFNSVNSNKDLILEGRIKNWINSNKGLIMKSILEQELRREVLPGVTLNHLVEEELLKNV